jgi:hypothetical protein
MHKQYDRSEFLLQCLREASHHHVHDRLQTQGRAEAEGLDSLPASQGNGYYVSDAARDVSQSI